MQRTLAALAALVPALAAAAPAFTTEAERTGFRRTGRHDEVVRLCAELQAQDPGRVRCATFGLTPEGRPMLAFVLSADGALTPETTRARGRQAILVQGGIHGGEIDGKDALLLALRDLLAGKVAPGLLGQVTLVAVPIFNVDGAERFGPNNRPNQRGPEEMGFRTTAQNLNLNRDYVKADAPEMRAMLGLLEAWDPVLYVDLHTTDGAKFQPDVAVTLSPDEPRRDGLDRVAAELSAALQARLRGLGHLPLPFYPDFRADDDPRSGFAMTGTPPRFSTGYAAARNRLGVLVETHSWKTHAQRVAAARATLQALFERALVDAAGWRAAEDRADAAAAQLAGTDVALTHIADETAGRELELPGYAYVIRQSEISGKPWIVYDESKPEVWRVPLFDRLRPDRTVHAPRAGYLVPAAHAAGIAPLLRLHGLRFETLARALPGVRAEGYHVDDVAHDATYEGRTVARLKGAWRATTVDLPAGSLYVPVAQPRALLVLHLLEPDGPDSLAAWGAFDAMLEQKEYMEDYVLEQEARRMLAADARLRTEFERRLRDDAGFAASPERRLRFFYERHPAWDDRIRWVPVYRVDEPPR